jgi:hypothetical protein
MCLFSLNKYDYCIYCKAMNTTKKFGFIWWATAGCGSRAFYDFIRQTGVDDLYNHYENTYAPLGAFTHYHGVPLGYEHLPIICSIRNPYSRIVSAYLDEKRQSGLGEKYSFEWWITDEYFSEKRYGNISQQDFFIHYWEDIGRKPDYFVRIETAYHDVKKIPMLSGLHDIEQFADKYLIHNHFKHENEYDEYIGEIQHYQKYYTREIADFVYERLPGYFEPFGYSKESWKLNY